MGQRSNRRAAICILMSACMLLVAFYLWGTAERRRAKVLYHAGAVVVGSDEAVSKVVEMLQSLGLFGSIREVVLGSHLEDPSLTVLTWFEQIPGPTNPGFSDSDLRRLLHVLQGMRGLRTVGILDCEVSDEGIGYLSTLDNFEELVLADMPITDAACGHLRNMEHLERLSVVDVNISGDCLKQLSALKELEVLELAGTNVTDESLKTVESMADLRRLSLASTKVRDKGISHIRDLTSLTSVDLRNTQITDRSLKLLARLPNLRELALDDTQITDRGMIYLAQLRHPRRLSLRNTQISDTGLMHLWNLAGVDVDLEGTQVTDEVREAWPKRNVLHVSKARAAHQYVEEAAKKAAAGDSERAIALLTLAIEKNAQLSVAFYNRGRIFLAQGKHEQAVHDFERAVALAPRDPSGWDSLSQVYAVLERGELALEAANEAIRLAPREPSHYRSRARAYEILGRSEEAERGLEQANLLESNQRIQGSAVN